MTLPSSTRRPASRHRRQGQGGGRWPPHWVQDLPGAEFAAGLAAMHAVRQAGAVAIALDDIDCAELVGG